MVFLSLSLSPWDWYYTYVVILHGDPHISAALFISLHSLLVSQIGRGITIDLSLTLKILFSAAQIWYWPPSSEYLNLSYFSSHLQTLYLVMF